MRTGNWLLRPSRAQRRVRLYCFCYAGVNAACFIPWQELLDPDIEVCAIQLPGRGARMAEPPYGSMQELVHTIAPLVAHDNKVPFALFGHSMGGLVAFEVARHCKAYNLSQPLMLFASGIDAPQFPAPPKMLHLLSDEKLLDELRGYNGTPAHILEDRELMSLILPTMRSDFALVENYRYRAGAKLGIPISVLAGRDDDPEALQDIDKWHYETSAECEVHWFDGDHFFINEDQSQDTVLHRISSDLMARLEKFQLAGSI